MRKTVFLFCLLCILSFSNEKLNVIVLDVESSKLDADYGISISEIIRTRLVNSKDFNVVDREKIELAIEEMKLQETGLVDIEDVGEIGKISGARKLVQGQLNQLGIIYILTIKLIDVDTLDIEKAIEIRGEDLSDLPNMADKAAEKLLKVMSRKGHSRRNFSFSRDNGYAGKISLNIMTDFK